MKKTILNSFIGAVVFSITCLLIFWSVKAWNSSSTGLPMDSSNPAELYVNSNETLTAAKRNKLVDKVSQINYDGSTTTINGPLKITGTLDIDTITCTKTNPSKNSAYDCDGNYLTTAGGSDVVRVKCPTGYIPIGGGGRLSTAGYHIRQTAAGSDSRYFAADGTIAAVSVSCIKIQ